MHRLRCGVIYTNAFADYLAQVALSPVSRRDCILVLDYVRMGSGPEKGQAWWRMEWLPLRRVAENCIFRIGSVAVCLSKQCQRGLRDRCLDWRNGTVQVRA